MNVAVIGTGYWGPNHVRVFNSLPGSHVRWVIDLDAKQLEKIRAAHPSVHTSQHIEEALSDPETDAIVIATPTSTHHRIAMQALAAGKHVLCEKPLCETTAQGEEICAEAQRMARVAMVGHVFLFNPGVIKLKELLDSGALGRVQYLAAQRTNLGPIRSDVNAVYDLATHDIAIFNWLLNETPVSVSATGAAFIRPNIEDVAFISLKYSSGAIAAITVSWLDPKKVRQITVVGTQQMATWDDMQPATPVAIYDKGVQTSQEYSDYGEFLRLTMWDGDVRMPKVRAEEPLRAQAQAFVQAVESGRTARSDAGFGLGVVKTLDAIAQSMRAGGASVSIA